MVSTIVDTAAKKQDRGTYRTLKQHDVHALHNCTLTLALGSVLLVARLWLTDSFSSGDSVLSAPSARSNDHRTESFRFFLHGVGNCKYMPRSSCIGRLRPATASVTLGCAGSLRTKERHIMHCIPVVHDLVLSNRSTGGQRRHFPFLAQQKKIRTDG